MQLELQAIGFGGLIGPSRAIYRPGPGENETRFATIPHAHACSMHKCMAIPARYRGYKSI